jgi:hypothetical protein
MPVAAAGRSVATMSDPDLPATGSIGSTGIRTAAPGGGGDGGGAVRWQSQADGDLEVVVAADATHAELLHAGEALFRARSSLEAAGREVEVELLRTSGAVAARLHVTGRHRPPRDEAAEARAAVRPSAGGTVAAWAPAFLLDELRTLVADEGARLTIRRHRMPDGDLSIDGVISTTHDDARGELLAGAAAAAVLAGAAERGLRADVLPDRPTMRRVGTGIPQVVIRFAGPGGDGSPAG